MKISVIIPVFNEENTIEQILKKVVEYLPTNSEIIVVDDGSTDKTTQKLEKIKDEKNIKIFSYHKNQGKGYAVRFGLSKAAGDIFIIQDADLEYSPKYYTKLLKPIKRGNTEVVYGSRLANHPLTLKEIRTIKLPHHFLANKFLSFLTNILYGSSLTDMETGYKVFTKKVYKKLNLTANDFEIETELTAKILINGHEIIEVPVETSPTSI